jgi:hypothetical protein
MWKTGTDKEKENNQEKEESCNSEQLKPQAEISIVLSFLPKWYLIFKCGFPAYLQLHVEYVT